MLEVIAYHIVSFAVGFLIGLPVGNAALRYFERNEERDVGG